MRKRLRTIHRRRIWSSVATLAALLVCGTGCAAGPDPQASTSPVTVAQLEEKWGEGDLPHPPMGPGLSEVLAYYLPDGRFVVASFASCPDAVPTHVEYDEATSTLDVEFEKPHFAEPVTCVASGYYTAHVLELPTDLRAPFTVALNGGVYTGTIQVEDETPLRPCLIQQ